MDSAVMGRSLLKCSPRRPVGPMKHRPEGYFDLLKLWGRTYSREGRGCQQLQAQAQAS